MKSALAAFAISLLALFSGAPSAQDYPAKPVRVVVPYLAGGIGADFVAKSAPYKGICDLVSAAALADLLGGQRAFMFDTVITSVPHIRSGKLPAYAVSSAKRASAPPEVRERIVTQGGSEVVTGSAEDFASLIKRELQQYARLVKDANIPSQ